MYDIAPTLILTARLALGVLFLTSAAGKLRDWPGFRRGVAAYRLLPPGLVPTASALLPVVELAVAALLLIGLAVPLAGIAAALLLVGFSAAVAVNLRRGRRISCGCHGIAGDAPISWGLVARNGVLLLLTLPLIGGAWWPAARAEWSAATLGLALLLAAGALLAAILVGQIVDVTLRARALVRG